MTKNAIIFSKNEQMCKLIKNELLLADFKTKTFDNPRNDIEGRFDVIVIDESSIEPSSISFIRSFISKNSDSVKICILESEESQKSLWGFNKYLSFPFRLEELRSLITTPKQSDSEPDDKANADTAKCFFADKDHRGVTLGGTYISLSQYEFNTLALLCANSGNCVSREDILKALNSTDGNISDVYISHLRSKLELVLGLKIIYTVRKKGYMTDYTLAEYLPQKH